MSQNDRLGKSKPQPWPRSLSDEDLARQKAAIEAEQRRRLVERLGEDEVRMREAEPFYP